MSTSTPSFTYTTILRLQKQHAKACSRLRIKAQSFREEGRSRNLVDSNIKLLKHRIEVMKAKERLERNYKPYGWDYTSNYISKPKKQPEYLQTLALICGMSSLSMLTGTMLLCIFSFVVHLKL